jgi:hypothetical protein
MTVEERNDDVERDEFDVDVVAGQRRGAHRAAAPTWVAALPWVLWVLFVITAVVTMLTLSGIGRSAPVTSPTATPTATPTSSAPPPPPEVDMGAALVVLTGTSSSRIDNRVADSLTEAGWIVVGTGSNEDRELATSLIVYKDPSLEPTAQALKAQLGANADLALDPGLSEDLRLVIGDDFPQ